jgi:hypothetical protein
MDGPGGEVDFLIQLIPITVMWLLFLVPAYFIAKRKGVSTTRFLIAAFPLWTGLFVLWWASLTDKAVLDRLEQLERRG